LMSGESKTALWLAVSRVVHESSQCGLGAGGRGALGAAWVTCDAMGAAQAVPATTTAAVAS